jgi:formate hydrogenlyase subunit 6/NADH:ubiquinone oxidoreductase subunit I
MCNACVEVCPTKCLIMDPVYPKALTSRDQRLYKTEVAGPKKKEPAADAEKPVKEPVKAPEGEPSKE